MRGRRVFTYSAVLLLAICSGTPVAAINVLMVTTNNGWLTSDEAGRKSEMEGFGYTVNTIWDGASQATFNTAFAANRAVWVCDEVTATDLGYKLREATIGVVNEHTGLVDELGLCTSSTTTTSSPTISIVNNTHYITKVFSTGAFSFGSSTYNVGRMGGTTASGAVVLGTVAGSNSAVAVDMGATLANTYNGSNVAFGRRVQFPLPVSINDGSTFGSNTYTLADRMLGWAAGLDRTIVAHWRLNETSGTSAADSSGFNRTGTVTGTATWTSAVRNNGFAFNGATQIQAAGLLGSHANLTVTAWANLTAADTNGAGIVSLGDHFYIRLDESGWTRAYMYNGTTWLSVGVNQTFAGTGWHHFAAIFDDDNNLFKLYIDGVQAASVTNTLSISYPGLGANTVIGRHGNGGTNHDFTGIIDEVRVYNYALSDTEVATLYGFIGHWKLSETAGTTAADSTIFARHGTVTSGATWSTRCNGDRTFEFNGTSQYISIPDATHLRPTESLTIAAWIRGDSWSTSNVVNLILRKGEATPNNWQLSVANNGRVALSLDAADPAPIQGNTVLTPGQWYHVAATWDGSMARIYLDGQLDASPVARSGTIGTDTRPVYIGGRSGGTDFFDGMIYDVRFYNRALNQAEIAKFAGFAGNWRFAEGSGTSAADSTPLANNATLSGGASWTSDCANNALLTNGAGAKAQTAAQFTPPSVGTVAFWMRGAGAPATLGRILGVNDGFEVRQEPTGVVSFDLGGSPSGGSEPFSTLSAVAEAGQWYHVAAVYSDVDNSFAVYVDGQLRTSGISPVDLVPQTAGILSFGARTGSSEFWNGALRDVRVYSRRLCPSEVAQLSGFVGHWALDETSGTNAADASLLVNHATYTNNPTLNVNGPEGRSVHFNGTNYAITNQVFTPPSTGTVMVWMRRNGPSGGRERLFGAGDNWEIWQDPDGLVRCDLGGDGNVGNFRSTTSMNSYQWYHIAAAFDDVSDTYRLYINGVLEVNGGMGMVAQAANQLTIAGRTGLAIERFHGDLDDLRIYSRILCPIEIQNVYNGGEPFDGVKIIKWVEIQ